MYNIIKTFRLAFIVAFVLSVIFLFFKHLFIPIIIFIVIMRLFKLIKFKKVQKNKNKESSTSKKNGIIDAEYEEVD